ncbi:response regulator [Aquabacterium sp. OR-4]|uniref:response regulator n=1 Tax=Aquabacterium sp. OR-4 TaxID=2978127 RepID=UPI0028C9624C|nr:response regulator [Aquabacterium sp. OR-4]MDT7836711.1 response regulator [Aquabacterium sp. OR-4]
MRSHPGQGSCCWFSAWLRLAETPAAALAATAGAPADHTRAARATHATRVSTASTASTGPNGRTDATGSPGTPQANDSADDNPLNHDVAEELRRHAGLHVASAHNGRQAVAMALEQRHALNLLDLQMPELDGLPAARQIRQQPGPDTPIVAMTANAFGEDFAVCLAAA